MLRAISRPLFIAAALTLGAASPALAAEEAVPLVELDQLQPDEMIAETDAVLEAPCWQFDGQPRRCINNGCYFNNRNNRCTQGGGGGGGQFYFVCRAQDSGWEEHFNGHQARGRNQQQAWNQALRECQRYHGGCRVVGCDQYRN